jgi:hypothetical protein
VAGIELERLDAEDVPREMTLLVRPDHGVGGTDDIGRSLDGERIPVEASLPAKPGAAELVAEASVTEARHEDVRRASAADERAEEDVGARLDVGDRVAAERVPDDDIGRGDDRGVLRDAGGDVLTGEVRSADGMASRLELRTQEIPAPPAVPGSVDEREGRHATILPCA